MRYFWSEEGHFEGKMSYFGEKSGISWGENVLFGAGNALFVEQKRYFGEKNGILEEKTPSFGEKMSYLGGEKCYFGGVDVGGLCQPLPGTPKAPQPSVRTPFPRVGLRSSRAKLQPQTHLTAPLFCQWWFCTRLAAPPPPRCTPRGDSNATAAPQLPRGPHKELYGGNDPALQRRPYPHPTPPPPPPKKKTQAGGGVRNRVLRPGRGAESRAT